MADTSRTRAAAVIRARERLLQIEEETERRVQERTGELRTALAVAQVANQTKTEFLDRMSHELRTPLNAVIGFANVLGKNTGGGFRAQDLTMLQRISANGRHLLSLIDSILDLSKIATGQTDLRLAPTALDTIVRDVVEQFQGMARNRPIELRVDIPSHVAAIDTDAEKVRRVLTNVVDNALKFTEVGAVTIQLLTDPVTARPRRVEVTDTGIGIPVDRLQAIFEPFEQVDNSTARKFEGIGLGLTLSRSLCDVLGYRLSVASTVGHGTTFTIDIPSVAKGLMASD